VGRRSSTLGTGCTAAAGVGRTDPAARGAVGGWPNQLLGLSGNAHMESRVQPVGLRFLRGLDPAVKPAHTTPALPVGKAGVVLTPCALWSFGREPSGPLSAGTVCSKTLDRPGRRPDDVMPAACLDSTKTTSALEISQAEQLSERFAGVKCLRGEKRARRA
jgi:hypothetical protein